MKNKITKFFEQNNGIIFKIIMFFIISTFFNINHISGIFCLITLITKNNIKKTSIFLSIISTFFFGDYKILQCVGCVVIFLIFFMKLKYNFYNINCKFITSILIFILLQLYERRIFILSSILLKNDYLDGLWATLLILIFFSFISFLNFFFSSKISCLIIFLVCVFISLVNFFVFTFTGNYLTLQDFFMVKTANTVAKGYTLSTDVLLYFILIVCITIVFFIFIIFLTNNKKERKCILFVSFLIGIYLLYILCFLSAYIPQEPFLYFIISCKDDFKKPMYYEELKDIYLDDIEDSNIEVKPNIIIIMDESFSEIHLDDNIKTNKPVLPYIEELKENTTYGYVYSSTFGNNTVSAEFECITGIPTSFTTTGARIYQLHLNENIPTLPKTLKRYGYNTYAIHAFESTGYNRVEAWNTFGFDNLIFDNDFTNRQLFGHYISDKSTFDEIIKVDKESQEPIFVMCITMQNHGPYTYTLNNIKATNVNSNQLNTYLSLINQTDQAFESLIEYYKNIDEETIIVFFGDHKPAIDDYNKTNDLYRKAKEYKIPYFIWANYDIDFDAPYEISDNYIGAIILNAIGIEDPWFNFVNEIKDEYPVISYYYTKENDKFISKNENYQFNKNYYLYYKYCYDIFK